MMIFVNIIAIYILCIFQCNLGLCELYTFEPPNLKTILFKETDLLDRCWSTHEVNLLLNRRVLQDLVPRKIPRDLPLLVKYLKSIEDTALKIPPGMNQTLILMAIGDVIGGYLQAIVLPIAKEAYYAGNIDYLTVAKLHGMLEKWRWYLSSDGGTWSQECDMRKIPTKVAILDVNMHDTEVACQELYVSGPKPNETDYLGSETIISESSRIPIPYLDNNVVPNAIALPFKKRNLFSLSDPKSAYILVKYYSLSMRCLSGNPNDILAFNNYFHVWIATKVVPHLHDQDRWYPAFGAVMRVVETIKQKGLASTNPVFVQPMGDEHQDAALNANLYLAGPTAKHSGKVANYFHVLNNPYALLMLFGIMLLLLSIVCCLCVCCCLWFRRKKKKPLLVLGDDSDDSILKNVMVSLYCGLKDSLTGNWTKLDSESSGKYVSQEKESEKQKYVSQEKESEKRKSTLDYNKSERVPYASNTPYSNPIDSSDVAFSVTSDSEEEYSGTSRDD